MARQKGSTNRGFALEKRPRASGKPWWRVVVTEGGKREAIGTFPTRTEANKVGGSVVTLRTLGVKISHDGAWNVTMSVDGTWYGVGVFATIQEAITAGSEAVNRRERGTFIKPDALTVGALLDQWLASIDVEATTKEDYAATISNHLKPHAISDIPVQKLTAGHVRSYLADLKTADVGDRTRQLAYMRLAQALKMAMHDEIVHRAVTDLVDKPEVKAKRGTAWSPDEASAFLAVAEDGSTYQRPTRGEGTRNPRPAELAMLPFWRLTLETGMRRGEVLGLRWLDVDFDQHTVDIRQTVTTLDNKAIVQERTKTDPSYRTVDLTPDTVEALHEHRKRWRKRKLASPAWQDTDLVFCTDHGAPIHPSNVDRAFSRLIKLAGVRRVTPHELRHTAASWLIADGKPLPEVARILGHSTPDVTARVYAHLINGQRTQAADTMSRLLSKRTG